MAQSLQVLGVAIVSGLLSSTLSLQHPAFAQIIPDATLGEESSQVLPIGNGDVIWGGVTRGGNLFHSFSTFNIANGEFAYFDSPSGIERIFSRVTGNSASEIRGALGVLGDADLFFLNPNGILFGPGSSLNVNGSFVATTANSFFFAKNKTFDARNTSNIPTLEINVPIGLQYGQQAPGDIRIINTSLSVSNGHNLSVVGGDIFVNNSSLNISSPTFLPQDPGTINLISADANSVLPSGFTSNIEATAAEISQLFPKRNIVISGSTVDATSNPGGEINFVSNNIDLVDGTYINSGVASGFNSLINPSEDINVYADGSVHVDQSNITNLVGSFSQGTAGDINIYANSLALINGGQINTFSFGRGRAGNLLINIKDQIFLNSGAISTLIYPEAIGNAGNIQVLAESLILLNGAFISSDTAGRGNAGDINIKVKDTVILSTPIFIEFNELLFTLPTSISTNVLGEDAIGNGGDIYIQAKNLFLNDFSLITTSTLSQGSAGNINLNIRENIILSKISSIESSVYPGAVGDSGDIDLISQQLLLEGGSQIRTILFREMSQMPGAIGEAGDIRINAQESVLISGFSTTRYLISTNFTEFSSSEGFSSGILASTERGTVGSAGDISITTRRMSVSNGGIINALTTNNNDAGDITVNAQAVFLSGGGQVLTSTRGGGQAGNIRFDISDQLIISGADSGFATRLAQFGEEVVNNQGSQSGIFANTAAESTGNGGNIFIDPELVLIQDGAGIGVNSLGTGQGGNITLQAGRLILDSQAFILAGTTSNQGGNITIDLSDSLFIRNGSLISTTAGTAQAGGDGGNIDITADFVVGVREENSDIAADAFEGNGGRVTISALDIFGLEFRDERTPFSDITASSEQGSDGITTFNQLTSVDVRQGLTELSENVVDPTGLIDRSCDVASVPESEFIVTGRGGLPPAPGDQLSGNQLLDDLGPETTQSTATQSSNYPTEVEQNEELNVIQEAQGWIVTETGQVQLVAVAPGEWLGGGVNAIAASNCP